MRCEILTDPEMFHDGAAMIKAMILAAPIKVVARDSYVGDCELLMTYGMGHPTRRPFLHRHHASGRHWIGWDLGYFRLPKAEEHRLGRAMRCTIDHDHPQAWIDDRPAERFDRLKIQLREDYDPKGPIIVVGLGIKTNNMLKQPVLTWETAALERIRRECPGRRIIFRPKVEDGTSLPGTERMVGMPIQDVLRGASLVVCRHSNVAVDACIAGVPVSCEDGAASLIYRDSLTNPSRPSRAERVRFLRNLAWWQWRPSEATQAWAFLLNRLNSHTGAEHEAA